ncbi:MAG: 3-isopropylmalate dehydratase [Candidatus Bipolaricaulia bacterium]
MGRAWTFGADVNTDVITPGRFNLTTDPSELAEICFCEVRPDFSINVQQGDFVVAGEHFGSGSSRETAAVALAATGIEAVIAPTFARIFYRNALNVGLLAVMAPTEGIEDGDDLQLDAPNGRLINRTQGTEVAIDPPPRFVREIVDAGGVVAYLNAHGGELPAMD